MTKLILITLLLLTGCGKPAVCIDGKLWTNANPSAIGNIYIPTTYECMETK